MSTFTGTVQLTRLILRVDRVRLTVWALVLGALPAGVASSFAALYPTEPERAGLVSTVASSPGLVALLGPVNGTSVGSLTVWRIGAIGAVFVALMAVFTVLRHTRLDEEEGRRELLGATVLGRFAPLAASFTAVGLVAVVIGLLATLGLVGVGESLSGSLAFGLGWMLTALVFAGLGGVAAQLTEGASAARAIAGGAIALFFIFRMLGDGLVDRGLGWLSWLSPIGWVGQLRAFGEERWLVLLIYLVSAAALVAVSLRLASERDVGAGFFATRHGEAEAPGYLSSALGLAWRLHRRRLVGWSIAVMVFGVVWGGLADTIATLLEDNPQLAEIIEALGGASLVDAFFAAAMGIIALIVSIYAISHALFPRAEEEALRAEHILATSTTRGAWVGSHLVFAFAGPVLLMALAGLTAGLTYSAVGDSGLAVVGDLVDTGMVQLPAIWVTAGIAVALYGLVPRLVALAWGFLVAFLILGQLGPILQFPDWSLNLSPFGHVPTPPDQYELIPLVTMTVVAAGLVAVGMWSLSKRDMG